MANTTKGKRLTKQQKVDIFEAIEDQGGGETAFAELVETGGLNQITKGTAFGKLVKNAYKAYQAVKKAADKQGVTNAASMEDLRDELVATTSKEMTENTPSATV